MKQSGQETMRISKLYRFRNRCFAEYVRLTREENRALDFIIKVNGWHTFDSTVSKPVHSLASKGFVEISEKTSQFRLASRFC